MRTIKAKLFISFWRYLSSLKMKRRKKIIKVITKRFTSLRRELYSRWLISWRALGPTSTTTSPKKFTTNGGLLKIVKSETASQRHLTTRRKSRWCAWARFLNGRACWDNRKPLLSGTKFNCSLPFWTAIAPYSSKSTRSRPSNAPSSFPTRILSPQLPAKRWNKLLRSSTNNSCKHRRKKEIMCRFVPSSPKPRSSSQVLPHRTLTRSITTIDATRHQAR